MVAMVAMPREYTENGSRQMKLPDAWWHPNAERELARMRDFWLVATMATGHHGHLRSRPLYLVGSLSPHLLPLHFFFQLSI